MFCKGGPGKNHQARLPGGLVGLEGLSFILSRTEPWNTVYILQGPTSPPGTFPWNVSIVLVFRLTSGSRNTSPYMASIRGRTICQLWFCRIWPNNFSPIIRLCTGWVLHSTNKNNWKFYFKNRLFWIMSSWIIFFLMSWNGTRATLQRAGIYCRRDLPH